MKFSWQQEMRRQYELTGEQIEQFEVLLARLTATADRGLTAVTLPESIIKIHFLDSLWLLKVVETQAAGKIVDIGSGAGFPGLPIAIAMPAVKITMLEANNKKAAFITGIIQELGLKNALVINQRAETVGRSDLRAAFDVALARAVGSLPEVLEYALPLLKKGGFALLQRGARETEDKKVALSAAMALGGSLNRIIKADPYPEATNLHLWVWEKAGDTPERFPRRPGMPRKRPL